MGQVVGLGGHIEAGETAAEAAVREAAEEAGVTVRPDALTRAAVLDFRFPARPAWEMTVTVFTCAVWTGEPVESDEVAPRWYEVADLPLAAMWDDARHWLGRVLAGERFHAAITYDDRCQRVVEARRTPEPPPRPTA